MQQNELLANSGSKTLLSRIDWPTTLFLVLVPMIALIAAPLYGALYGVSWSILIFSLVFAAATNLSITAGYHRLFAHRSYQTGPLVRAIYLLIGASAWQGSCLKWSADHRVHHNKVDSDQDPYSINKGFWYAHMGWMFLRDTTNHNPKAADLEADWMVRFQHRFFVPLGILMGFGFPTLVGAQLGSAWAGLIFGGFLRIALTQQSTFFVNSLCHTLGKQTYSMAVSARDSFFVAVLTHGEGYHNFHHRFQIDYRNGIRWYHWDPTKWIIRSLAFFGLAKGLRQVSPQEILRVRLQTEAARIQSKGYSEEMILQLKEKILSAQITVRKLREDYFRLKQELQDSSHEKLEHMKVEIELRKMEFQYAKRQWKLYLRGPRLA